MPPVLRKFASSNRKPVILVPGTLGSRIRSRFLYEEGLFQSYASACWFSSFSLLFKADKNGGGIYNSPPYLSSYPADFGRVESIAYLNPQDPEDLQQPSFQPVISYLEHKGYTSNREIFAAPYDFRFAAGNDWMKATARLIENTVCRNGHRKAVIYSFSLGCLYMLRFLHVQSHPWRSKYIDHWVAVGCPFAGAIDVPKLFASGDEQGLTLDPSILRSFQITAESNLWLMPNPNTPWAARPLVIDRSTNPATKYNVHDLDNGKFLKAALRPHEPRFGLALPRLRNILGDFLGTGAPHDVHCTFIYRTGLDTSFEFIYNQGLYGNVTVVKKPHGDGRVTDESRILCEEWKANGNGNTSCILLDNIPEKSTGTVFAHDKLFYDPQSLDILHKVITSD